MTHQTTSKEAAEHAFARAYEYYLAAQRGVLPAYREGNSDKIKAAHELVLDCKMRCGTAARYASSETITLRISKYTSSLGLLREIEALIREHGIIDANTRTIDSQFVWTLQAFQYFCELSRDPWSERAKGDFDRVVAAAKKHCGIIVEVQP